MVETQVGSWTDVSVCVSKGEKEYVEIIGMDHECSQSDL